MNVIPVTILYNHIIWAYLSILVLYFPYIIWSQCLVRSYEQLWLSVTLASVPVEGRILVFIVFHPLFLVVTECKKQCSTCNRRSLSCTHGFNGQLCNKMSFYSIVNNVLSTYKLLTKRYLFKLKTIKSIWKFFYMVFIWLNL